MTIGIGGAPTRATTLPTDAAERKTYPISSGVLDYFPDAIASIAHLSWKGNEQHNPGMPLHWDRTKSGDEGDTLQRHYLERGTRDKDGIRHSTKVAWRALALLQKEIEAEQAVAEAARTIALVDSLLDSALEGRRHDHEEQDRRELAEWCANGGSAAREGDDGYGYGV